MMSQNLRSIEENAPISAILDNITETWPEHQKFIHKSFSERSTELLETSEQIAAFVLKIAGHDLQKYCDNYRWTCERLLEEELYFRRNNDYRLKSLEDAISEIYSNDEYMDQYLNGLLLSQLMWVNHTRSIDFYRRTYLPELPENSSHLEIGPGHGLFLYMAAQSPNVSSIAGWDISQTALDQTLEALRKVGFTNDIRLEIQDATNTTSEERFDSVVMSEILEHLEDPHKALQNAKSCLKPDGRIFVNVPVNSPAPDHIYLLRTPEESCALLEDSGFSVLESAFYPTGNYSLEKARKNALTISCAIIATPR